MTQHTGRDTVWDTAVQTAVTEGCFSIDDISQSESVSVSERTVRDTISTMADLGWLERQNVNESLWQPGELLTQEEGKASEDALNKPKQVTDFDQVSELKQDEIYVGTVDKASSNALIWLDESGGPHINLGPIDGSSVGEEVRFRYLQGVWGRCLDNEYTYEGYNPKQDGSSSSSGSSSYRTSRRSSSSGTSRQFSKTRSSSSAGGTITEKDPDNKNKLLKGNL